MIKVKKDDINIVPIKACLNRLFILKYQKIEIFLNENILFDLKKNLKA